MGLTWSDSYIKDPLVRTLWKELRAVPVLPIMPSLDVLQVLTKRDDGFVIVGNLASVSVAGNDKTWLDALVKKRDKRYFKRPTTLGAMKSQVSTQVGGFVNLLVGEIGAKVGLTKAKMLDISVPSYEIAGVPGEKWEEVMEHFKPNLNLSTMGPFSFRGKIDLFIVQEVIKVPYIAINATDNVEGGLEGAAPAVTLPIQIKAGLKLQRSKDGKYLLKSSNKTMMPVAFRGWTYTYDKFGRREKRARPTKFQPDSVPDDVGASTSASAAPVENPEIAAKQAEDEDDGPQNDENMRSFLEDNGWYATILHPDQNLEILPRILGNEADEGEGEGEEEEDDDNEEEPESVEIPVS